MILAIGNINIDIICHVPRLPQTDDKVIVSDLTVVPGGGAANFAVGLARLYNKVALYGHVGDDQNGVRALNSLKKEKVDVSNVQVEANSNTGFVMILVDDAGETIKIGYRQANSNLQVQNITSSLIEKFKHVHLSSVPSNIAFKTAKVCQDLDISSSIDFGGELMNESSTILQKLIPRFSFVFMNKIGFASTFNTEPTLSYLQSLDRKNFGIINLTLGDRGSYVITSEDIIKIPIWQVPVRDTTGAGDAYAAGFIHQQLQNKPLKESGEYAAACASLQIAKENARDGMPTFEEVEEFIRTKTIQDNRG